MLFPPAFMVTLPLPSSVKVPLLIVVVLSPVPTLLAPLSPEPEPEPTPLAPLGRARRDWVPPLKSPPTTTKARRPRDPVSVATKGVSMVALLVAS